MFLSPAARAPVQSDCSSEFLRHGHRIGDRNMLRFQSHGASRKADKRVGVTGYFAGVQDSFNVLFFHLADLDQMGKRLRDLRGKRREPPLNGFFHENLRKKKAGDSHPHQGIEIPGGVKNDDVSGGNGLGLSAGTSDRWVSSYSKPFSIKKNSIFLKLPVS